MDKHLTVEDFTKCVKDIVSISDRLMDGWTLIEKKGVENDTYITKRCTKNLTSENKTETVTFEYHIAYHLSYSVPILCFKIWKQDGSMLSLEQYWEMNTNLKDSNMYDTLTQLDHPVLCQPFLTLHPCRTQEVIAPFFDHSKNPVVSWLSIVGPFVHLDILEDYITSC